ncbi:MAG: hypothetical protein GF411_17985 [Candidatus Lokiarchaeota archaeon]|nr:hypothetical protein [Candidatus Lokiarchaeota archaeon]
MNRTRSLILSWFSSFGRSFPWRSTDNAFHILIAEMMLRRTTAQAVARLYSDFIVEYGTVDQLASANVEIVSTTISSLGLQNTRSKHLVTTAKIIQSDFDSLVPSGEKDLVSLPGVGKYVANAVRNFAFHYSVPLVDGNILHFLNRVFSLQFKNAYNEQAWSFMNTFGAPHKPQFYFGIIDLVSLVCLRKNSRCEECPVRPVCDSSLKGMQKRKESGC